MIKKYALLFALILMNSLRLCSQNDSALFSFYDEEPTWGFTTYAQASHLFFTPTEGLLDITFPYRLSGVAGLQTFHGSTNGFHKNDATYISVGMEVNHHNWAVDGNIAPFTILSSGVLWNMYLGVTYRVRYENWLESMADLQKQFVAFPVSFSAGIENYNAISKLGRIRLDSGNVFNAFGSNMGLTEHEDEYGFVNVMYQQKMLAFRPTINVGYKPKYGNFLVEVRFGPYLPFFSRGGLNFFYRDSDADDQRSFPSRFGTVPLRGNGIHAHYNGSLNVPDNPYPIKGWMLSVRVGFNSGDLFRPHHYQPNYSN